MNNAQWELNRRKTRCAQKSMSITLAIVSVHPCSSELSFCTTCPCGFRPENEDKDKAKKEAMAKQKIRQNYIFKSEEPDLQESVFWKKIIAYQRKLLVGHVLHWFYCSLCWKYTTLSTYFTHPRKCCTKWTTHWIGLHNWTYKDCLNIKGYNISFT